MPERTYTEEEVASIFARAAERERPAIARSGSTGLTLAEIEHAGREAGLDPLSVRAAAGEVEAQRGYPQRSSVAVAERWVETPLKEGAWEDLVASLRYRFGSSTAWLGKDTTTLGTAQEWTHTSASGDRTTVTLSPREGRTLLRVVREGGILENARSIGWGLAAFVALIPSVLAGAFVAGTLGWGNLAAIVAMLLVFVSIAAIGGPRIASRVRKNREQQSRGVQAIADDLADQLGKGRPQPRAIETSEAVGTRMDISALDELASEADVQSERRKVRP